MIPYTFNLKSTVHLANTIAIIKGKSLNVGQSDYPTTPQDTPGHSETALFVFFNMLYERVDGIMVLIIASMSYGCICLLVFMKPFDFD